MRSAPTGGGRCPSPRLPARRWERECHRPSSIRRTGVQARPPPATMEACTTRVPPAGRSRASWPRCTVRRSGTSNPCPVGSGRRRSAIGSPNATSSSDSGTSRGPSRWSAPPWRSPDRTSRCRRCSTSDRGWGASTRSRSATTVGSSSPSDRRRSRSQGLPSCGCFARCGPSRSKCSVRGDFLYDVAWCTFWGAWHPGIAAVDVWGRLVADPPDDGDPDALVAAGARHHCYELQIGANHLGWHAWTGDEEQLRAVATRTRDVLERGPLPG